MRHLFLIALIACGTAPKKTTGATGSTGDMTGEDDGTNPQSTTGKNFTIVAGQVNVSQGGSKQVNINFTRTGGSFPITVTAGESDVGGIRATFAMATTSANQLSATIEVAPSVALGNHNIKIEASGEGVSRTATVSIVVVAKALAGKVIDELGRPVEGADVLVGGSKDTSDPAGAFDIPSATGTVDIMVKKDNSVYVFKGISRTDPTLQLFGYAPWQPYGAEVMGNITNGAPAPSGIGTQAIVLGTQTCCGDYVLDVVANYDEYMYWSASQMANATLHSLRWAMDGDTGSDFRPITFLGYGKKENVGMIHEQLAGGQDIALSSVSTSNLAGDITVGSDYVLFTRDVYARLPGENASLPIGHETSFLQKHFSYPVPVIAGGSVGVMQVAQGSKGTLYAYASDITPPKTDVKLNMPNAPVPTLPNGKVTTMSNFSFTPMSGGAVHVAEFYTDPPSDSPRIYVIGASTQVRLPDLAPVGLSYPASGGNYVYVVHGFSVQTMDLATGPDGFAQARGAFMTGRAPKGSGTFASSYPPKSFSF